MKKVGSHNSISRILFFSLALMLTFSFTSFAQDAAPAAAGADPVKGKELYNANCAACHKLDAKSTGPALRNVADKHEKAWLYKWIHNSSEMIKSGDPVHAVEFCSYSSHYVHQRPEENGYFRQYQVIEYHQLGCGGHYSGFECLPVVGYIFLSDKVRKRQRHRVGSQPPFCAFGALIRHPG